TFQAFLLPVHSPCGDCTKHCTKLVRSSVGTPGRGAWKRDDFARTKLDLKLRLFFAKKRPGQRRVHVHDVTARAVRDDLEHVFTRAVGTGECDEAATKVVLTAQA